MVDFNDGHRKVQGVEPPCEVLPIAPSTYYEHKLMKQIPKRGLRGKSVMKSYNTQSNKYGKAILACMDRKKYGTSFCEKVIRQRAIP